MRDMREPIVVNKDTGPKGERGWYVVVATSPFTWDELAGPFDAMADAEQWLHENTEPEEEV